MKSYEFWIDKVAKQVVEREEKLKRGIRVLRTESGLGASGFPHLGSFADVVRQYGVTLALKEMGFKSEFIAYSDDRDGLRKVALTLPNWLEKFIGFPVSNIPDPFKCCESFGSHMSSLLIDAMERAGIDFKFHSGAENYRKGLLDEQIEKILLSAELIGRIVKELTGQEKFLEILPYFPVCERCGRIYTTRAFQLLKEEHKVLYKCDQEFRGENKNTGKEIVVTGCGFEGEASYLKGGGKLSWKGEFAARWDALKIVFEAHGKDILDSVRVNDAICRAILGFEPPIHIMYEMFLDKSGKKISKSYGNVFTPQVWLNYASMQSMLLLMFKRFEGTRELDVTDIPFYMDELDRLEKIYFGLEKVKKKRELVNLKRLFEFVHFLEVPRQLSIHVPYSKMVEIAKILPKKKRLNFAIKKLKDFHIVVHPSQKREVEKRLNYASNWVRDFEKVEKFELKLGEREKEAIKDLISTIEKAEDGEKLQEKIFEISRKNQVEAPEFFKLIYKIILKSEKGPRLGPYILEIGKQEVVKKLREYI